MNKQKGMFMHSAQYWSEERNLVFLLVALLFDAFILYPLVSVLGSGLATQIINSLVLSVILLLGLFALTRHKVTRMIFAVIIVMAILGHLVRFIPGANFLAGWDLVLSIVTIIAFVILILMHAFKEGPVTWHRIREAVAAYLLISIAFALGDHLIAFFIPGAFKFSDNPPNIGDPAMMNTFQYFSISTITTLGYGDIVPVHPLARTLAMMEAFVGQLYPALLLARLVSLYIVDSRRAGK
jgi:hypothetical protein